MKRKFKARLRRAGIGALPILAGLMMASGFLRLGDGAGQAIAREISQIATASGEQNTSTPAPVDDVAAVLEALEARETRLDEREAAIVRRELVLAETETKIREQMDLMADAEAELDALLKLAESAADDDIARLTTVYENMKPKDAAALFEQMEPQFAAGFLGRMRPEAAASIMAGLAPETAYSVSVMLAGRHANLPLE